MSTARLCLRATVGLQGCGVRRVDCASLCQGDCGPIGVWSEACRPRVSVSGRLGAYRGVE